MLQSTRPNEEEHLEFIRGNFDISANHGTEDALFSYGASRDALSYARLFSPDFVEVEGSVLLASFKDINSPQQFREAKRTEATTLTDLEENFNWIEPSYVLADRPKTDREEELLCRFIASSWDAYLKARFPERTFAVRLIPAEETGDTLGVGFSEVR